MKRFLSLFILVSSGCATALSTAQPAEALHKGSWRASGGMEVGVPVSRIVDAVDAATELEDKYQSDPNYVPTDADKKQYLDAAIGLALNAPGPIVDVMLRRGFGYGIDIGGRYTSTGWQGDVKWQFLDGEWDGAISVGYASHVFDGLIFDALSLLKVEDFSRHDVMVPIIFGKRLGGWGRFWFGPKLQIASVHVDAKLERVDETLTTDGSIFYVGGFGGAALGWKGFEIYGELTAMELFAKPTIFGEKRDLGGLVIAPTVGLSARF